MTTLLYLSRIEIEVFSDCVFCRHLRSLLLLLLLLMLLCHTTSTMPSLSVLHLLTIALYTCLQSTAAIGESKGLFTAAELNRVEFSSAVNLS